MGNRWSSLKRVLCCSRPRTTSGVHQGDGLPQSPHTAPPTLEDPINLFKETADTLNIDALIQAIDQLLQSKLNVASTSNPETASGSTDLIANWTSAIGNGAMFLKFVNEHTEKIDAKADFFPSGRGQKVVGEILQQLGQLHWIVGGLSIIAYLLNKVEKVSENRSECIQLLKRMFDLAHHIKKLKGQLPREEIKLKDAFVLIVEGCMTCASQLQSGKFFRFLSTSVNTQALNDLTSKINSLYQNLTFTTVTETHATVTEIQRDQPVLLPLLPPTYPEGAVGLEKPLEELGKKIDLKTTEVSSRVVVIYGVGGIGKTTLARTFVATLVEDLKDYSYTKIEINEDPHMNDLKSMQQQILRDCFPTYQSGRRILLRNYEEGREHIKEAFKCGTKKPVFIFIDNALRSQELKELFPEDLRGFPQGSRILLTTRNLAATDLFSDRGIPRHHYAVNPLSKEHGIELLGIDPAYRDRISNHVENIMQIAGGIPLALKIVGAHLRKQKYKVENCSLILNALEHGEDVKEDDLSERLIHFVYNGLELSSQEAFLDICFLFNGWDRRHVEYIVGVEEFTSLADAALVTSMPYFNSFQECETVYDSMYSMGEEKVIVHDVVHAKGRQMGESTRIKDWSRAQKSKVIKGIKLGEQHTVIEQSQVSCLSDSLRLLILRNPNPISARCSETFEKLRYLELSGHIAFYPMNLEGLPCLSFYKGPISEEFVMQLPQTLKYLRVYGGVWTSSKQSKSIQAVRNSSLEEFRFSGSENMRVIFDGRFHFDALKILWLEYWKKMEELPPQVCGMASLNKLHLENCRSLKRLPESVVNLRALTHLDLGRCDNLEELSSSFGEVTTLRCLNLVFCKALRKLPDNFGQLSQLEYLCLWGCERLKELPPNFAQLSSLKELDLQECSALKELPTNFVHLSLEVLFIGSGVHKLLMELGQINDHWIIKIIDY